MKKTVTCNLEMSERDLILLISALSSARLTKSEILRFYENNPDALQVTPLSVLQDEYDSLDRLIHTFSVL